VKKYVIAAPGVDKSEAPVRESLDGAFCHLLHFLRDRPEALPENTVLGILHREAQIVSGQGMTSTVGGRPPPDCTTFRDAGARRVSCSAFLGGTRA